MSRVVPSYDLYGVTENSSTSRAASRKQRGVKVTRILFRARMESRIIALPFAER